MTPRERLLRTMRGETADRVPLSLIGFHCRGEEALDAMQDPLRRAVSERILDQTHFDVGVPAHINRFLVTPPQRMATQARDLGNGHREVRGVIDTPKGELTYLHHVDPDSGTTWTVKYPVETEDDIEKITSIPWELPRGLGPPQLERLLEAAGQRGIVRTGISSPVVCVAGMMSYELFLEMCATHLELMQELTELCLWRTLDVLDVLFSKPGIEYVWIGGSEWVTPPMGSPAVYDALVQEQERAIIDFIRRKSMAVVHIHCHGHVRHALERTIEREADYTEPIEAPPDGDITMAEAKRLADGRITLGGNLEARVLCSGTPDDVTRAVEAAFDGGKQRFVLQPTAGPSPKLGEHEFRNWMRVIDVWEALSPIQ